MKTPPPSPGSRVGFARSGATRRSRPETAWRIDTQPLPAPSSGARKRRDVSEPQAGPAARIASPALSIRG